MFENYILIQYLICMRIFICHMRETEIQYTIYMGETVCLRIIFSYNIGYV
jgi:hypothetical protein